jgi:hypothetical protein
MFKNAKENLKNYVRNGQLLSLTRISNRSFIWKGNFVRRKKFRCNLRRNLEILCNLFHLIFSVLMQKQAKRMKEKQRIVQRLIESSGDLRYKNYSLTFNSYSVTDTTSRKFGRDTDSEASARIKTSSNLSHFSDRLKKISKK